MKHGTAVVAAIGSALVSAVVGLRVVEAHSDAAPPAPATAVTSSAWRPLDNDCSGGTVTFTFDDGPREHTGAVLARLAALRVKAVFFVNGMRVDGREQILRTALAQGHVLANHTWSHPDLVTGRLPSGELLRPWSQAEVRDELARTTRALMDVGAPRPTLYRPPYGSVNAEIDATARDLGLRLVMPWGYHADDNILDTHDNEGATTEEMVASVREAITSDSIITMHDGQGAATLKSLAALQPIVDIMNARSLCASTEVRPDATGRVLKMYG